MTRAVAASRPERRRHVSLRGSAEFSGVYKAGVRRRKGELVVIALPGRPGPARVGIVAGRRIGNAVARNRAKRRLRAAVDEAGLREGTSYVVVALTDLSGASFGQLVEWLRQGAADAGRETEHGP